MFWGFQWSRQNSVLWDTLSEAHTELIYKAMAMNMLVKCSLYSKFQSVSKWVVCENLSLKTL